MFVFARCMFQPATFRGKPLVDNDLKNIEIYAKYLTNQKFSERPLTKNVSAKFTIQVARRTLGDELWQKLLKLAGEEALQVAAEVIEDYLFQHDPYKTKDLQLNLITNVVKEAATNDYTHKSRFCQLAEEFMRKLSLDVSFRKEIEDSLLNNGAIYEPWLIITRKAA